MVYRRTPLVLLAAVVAALSGCSHANANDDGPSADDAASLAASDFPTLHLEQTAVLLSQGKPQVESNYRKDLDDCRKSGVATTPIADADVGKIGRRHITRTVEATRSSERTQEWSFELPAPCQFRLEEKDELVIYTPDGKAYSIDQRTHKGDVQDVGVPQPPEPTSYTSDEEAVDNASGWKHMGNEVSAGQSCAVWTGPGGDRVCVWDKGEKWGYARKGMNVLGSDGASAADAIVLWAEPGKGTGWKLHTDVFTVGQSRGEAPFTVPRDATLSTRN